MGSNFGGRNIHGRLGFSERCVTSTRSLSSPQPRLETPCTRGPVRIGLFVLLAVFSPILKSFLSNLMPIHPMRPTMVLLGFPSVCRHFGCLRPRNPSSPFVLCDCHNGRFYTTRLQTLYTQKRLRFRGRMSDFDARATIKSGVTKPTGQIDPFCSHGSVQVSPGPLRGWGLLKRSWVACATPELKDVERRGFPHRVPHADDPFAEHLCKEWAQRHRQGRIGVEPFLAGLRAQTDEWLSLAMLLEEPTRKPRNAIILACTLNASVGDAPEQFKSRYV